MAEGITELTTENFDDFVSSGNVIVDFWAEWCGPCQMTAPEFEKAASENKNVKFGKVDVDGNQDLAGRFGVMSIPTVIFFKDKEQIDRHIGAMFEKEISKKIEENFG